MAWEGKEEKIAEVDLSRLWQCMSVLGGKLSGGGEGCGLAREWWVMDESPSGGRVDLRRKGKSRSGRRSRR